MTPNLSLHRTPTTGFARLRGPVNSSVRAFRIVRFEAARAAASGRTRPFERRVGDREAHRHVPAPVGGQRD